MRISAPEYKFNVKNGLDTRLGTESGVFAAATALVVIDAQAEYCTAAANRDNIEDALDGIESARAAFNRLNLPVFLVYTAKPVHPGGLPREDAHLEGDTRLYRQYLTGNYELCAKWAGSAFREKYGDTQVLSDETFLHRALRHDYPKVNHLVFCGFHLGLCVTETALDAVTLGYEATILPDAVANGYDQPMGIADYNLRVAADFLLLSMKGVKPRRLSELSL